MTTLTELWSGMDGRRRGFLIGGLAALAVILVILTRLATAPSYELLYAGLDPAAASDVVAAVEARGVPYRVQGDTILVDSRERDALRMALAGEGLPANGAAGYELLDGLSGFGTTSQMFDAAYWRAREGELARTIISSPRIRAARVHIANPGADPFQPARDVTASVALRPAAGGWHRGMRRRCVISWRPLYRVCCRKTSRSSMQTAGRFWAVRMRWRLPRMPPRGPKAFGATSSVCWRRASDPAMPWCR